MCNCDECTGGDTRAEEDRKVCRAGYLAGCAAGSWVIDGNTSRDAICSLWYGLDSGDPETLDALPTPPSGEWADDPSPDEILSDVLECPPRSCLRPEVVDDLWPVYSDAFSSGVVDEVEWTAGTHLGVLNASRYPQSDDARRAKMADEHVDTYCGVS